MHLIFFSRCIIKKTSQRLTEFIKLPRIIKILMSSVMYQGLGCIIHLCADLEKKRDLDGQDNKKKKTRVQLLSTRTTKPMTVITRRGGDLLR